MITAEQIVQKMISVFTGQELSTAVVDFCQSNFGKKLTLFDGVNFDNPPTDDACPAISIHKYEHKGLSKSSTETSYLFEITVSVYNELKTITDTDDYKQVSYQGEKQAEQFMYLVQSEILSIGCPLQYNFQDIEFSGAILYPVFEASLQVKISIQKTLGGFEPTL